MSISDMVPMYFKQALIEMSGSSSIETVEVKSDWIKAPFKIN